MDDFSKEVFMKTFAVSIIFFYCLLKKITSINHSGSYWKLYCNLHGIPSFIIKTIMKTESHEIRKVQAENLEGFAGVILFPSLIPFFTLCSSLYLAAQCSLPFLCFLFSFPLTSQAFFYLPPQVLSFIIYLFIPCIPNFSHQWDPK